MVQVGIRNTAEDSLLGLGCELSAPATHDHLAANLDIVSRPIPLFATVTIAIFPFLDGMFLRLKSVIGLLYSLFKILSFFNLLLLE
jgi:hypothetical protein